MQRGRRVRNGLLGAAIALFGGALPSTASAGQTPVPIPRDANWLTTVNYYRRWPVSAR